MPKLVENNMTNKSMGPKSLLMRLPFFNVYLIRLTNLQFSYKGKTNTHYIAEIKNCNCLSFYELFA